MDKYYDNCRFTMLIPLMKYDETGVTAKVTVIPKKGASGQLVFINGSLTDPEGGMQAVEAVSAEPAVMQLGSGKTSLSVRFPLPGFRTTGSAVCLTIMVKDKAEGKLIRVYFQIVSDVNKTLMGVEVLDAPVTKEMPNDLERSFENCRFKVLLPLIKREIGQITARFMIEPKSGAEGTLRLESCQLIDSEGDMQEVGSYAADPEEMELSLGKETFTVWFSMPGIRRAGIGMNLIVVLIDEERKEKIQVYYELHRHSPNRLLGIERTAYEEPNPIPPIPVPPTPDPIIPGLPFSDGGPNDGLESEEEISECTISALAQMDEYAGRTLGEIIREISTNTDSILSNQELQEEAVSILNKNVELQKQLRELEEKNKTLASEIEQLEERCSELEQANGRNDVTGEELETMKASIAALEQEGVIKDKEIAFHRLLTGKLQNNIQELEQMIDELKKELQNTEQTDDYLLSEEEDVDRHLNSIIEYMEPTIRSKGIQLTNVHIATSDGYSGCNASITGEIVFAPEVSALTYGVTIKIVVYDSNNHIFEVDAFDIPSDFSGFDVFEETIGLLKGYSEEDWLKISKIRVFAI